MRELGLCSLYFVDEGPRLKLGYKVRVPIPRVLSVQGLCAPADRVTILQKMPIGNPDFPGDLATAQNQFGQAQQEADRPQPQAAHVD